MNKIVMLTIDHKSQRYPTVGDYQEAHGIVMFTVSNMNNDKYEALVMVHELIEYLLVKARGIDIKAIDDFDIAFEANRAEGDESEPGHDPKAPYNREHIFAEKIERLLARELEVMWPEYDKTVSEL